MKRDQIKPCVLCGKGVAHDRCITFYRVRLTRLGISLRAVQAQTGLEMMLGHAGLAQIMGPDEDLAVEIGDEQEALVCDTCALTKDLSVAHFSEIMYQKAATEKKAEPDDE